MINKTDLPGSDLVGKYCRHLPDDEEVLVTAVYANGKVTVIRIGGERPGTEAETTINHLKPELEGRG